MKDLNPFFEIPILIIISTAAVLIGKFYIFAYLWLDEKIEKTRLETELIKSRLKELGEETEGKVLKNHENEKSQFLEPNLKIGVVPEVGLWQFILNAPLKKSLNSQHSPVEFTMFLRQVEIYAYSRPNSPEIIKFLAWIVSASDPSSSPIYRIERAAKYIFWRWEQDRTSVTVEARVVSPRKIEDIEGKWYAQWIAPL